MEILGRGLQTFVSEQNLNRALVGSGFQQVRGESNASLIAPESYTLEQHFLDRAGSDEIQLDLFESRRSRQNLRGRLSVLLGASADELLRVSLRENHDLRLRTGGKARSQFVCHPDQRREGVCFHLSHNMPTMKLDGVFGNAQLKSNLLVQKSLHQERQKLLLPWCQRLIFGD